MTSNQDRYRENNKENKTLSESDQVDDTRWDQIFASSPDTLARLAATAMAEYHSGKTEELNPDTIHLSSIPGMGESIQKGLTTPIEDCNKELE